MKKKFVFALIFVLPITILILIICVFGLTVCKKNDVPNHTHNYVDTVVEPTCTEQGYILHECSCGEKYSDETVLAVGHDYVEGVCTKCGDVRVVEHEHDFFDEWTVDTLATCAKKGSKSRHCKICGAKTDVTAIALLEHNYVGDVCIVCGDEKLTEATGLEYTLSDDQSYYIVSGIGTETRTKFIIPSTYEGKPVKEIEEGAFYNCGSLKSVTIPDSVTSIASSAFNNCSKLTSITIPDSVTSIGAWAFDGCDKLQYNEYDNAYYLGNDDNPYLVLVKAKDTSITSCTINEKTKIIYHSAFGGCGSLQSITISDSVTSIGYWAFRGCSSLKGVYITDIAAWCNIEFEDDPSNPLCYAHNLYLNNELVTDLVIPNTVTAIENYAFEGASCLQSVTIPDSVTSIGGDAFYYCNSLTSVTIGNGVTSIGHDAFSGCYKLVEVINKSNLSITKGSLSNGYVACYALNVKTEGTSDIVNVNDYLFITDDNNVNYLVDYVGNDTKLILPNNYNEQNYVINQYAFYDCDCLISVIIGNSVTSIGLRTFYDCRSLTSITIPNSVTSIDYDAFCNCSGLKTINFNGTREQWKAISKETGWKYNTGEFTVYCTDETLTKDDELRYPFS